MRGSEFAREYAGKGLTAWGAAALELARQGSLVPWPWVDVVLADDSGNTATLKISSDYLAVGDLEDHVRLPLTPSSAQNILNLSGSLLPTPWLEYRIWQQAPVKLAPTAAVPNKGANLDQYAQHSALVDEQLRTIGAAPGMLVSGQKKDVIVSNIHKPGKVLIFGWRRPPPAPDVFDDGRAMTVPDRQPVQPKSNVHGDFYVDYSHGIRAVAPIAIVNGQEMTTADLYRHPTLSRLVSNEGPLRFIRYPARVPPAEVRPAVTLAAAPPTAIDTVDRAPDAPFTQGMTDIALDALADDWRRT